MSSSDIEIQTSTIETINQAIQDCVAAHDIDRAIALAVKRQKALVEIVQLAENTELELGKLVESTLDCVSKEQMVLKAHSSKKRNDYLVRKSAIEAYLAPIAA